MQTTRLVTSLRWVIFVCRYAIHAKMRVLWCLCVVISVLRTTSTSFIYGQPCSERNTAYLQYLFWRMPYDSIKCVDMTGFKRIIKERFSLLNYTRFLAAARTADTLYADHMNLTGFPVSLVRALPNLELIDLQGNKIRRLPIRMHLVAPKLHKLLIADNRVAIPKSKPLMVSDSIRTLMLSNNGIEHIFRYTFAKLPALEVLYLDGNRLRNISPMVGVLPSLKYLHVGRNYLQTIPAQHLKYYVTKDQIIPED